MPLNPTARVSARPQGSREIRSLSLIPESASSANEEVRFTVIGQDAWCFSGTVVGEANRKFPTLCGGGADTTNGDGDYMTCGEPGARESGKRLSNAGGSRASTTSARTSKMIKEEELPELEAAPLSCKFWLDGMRELEPQSLHTSEEDQIYPSSESPGQDGITDAYQSSKSAERLRKEIEEENSGSPTAGTSSGMACSSDDAHRFSKGDDGIVPGTTATSTSLGSSPKAGSKAKKKSSKEAHVNFNSKDKSKKASSNELDGGKKARRRSIASLVSSVAHALSTRKFADDDEDGEYFSESSMRKVVSARYFPVETFSEEMPKCKNFKTFKESVMLFLVDDRDEEVTCEEEMSNLHFRKSEVDRWMKAQVQKHSCHAAPAMMCVVLMHRAPEYEYGIPSPDSQSSFKMPPQSQASMKVNVCGSDPSLPGSMTELERRSEATKLFVDDLRKITQSAENDRLWYECNFDDGEALLKFIVRLSATIIERRHKDDPSSGTAAAFAARLQNSMHETKRCARCRRCSCVVS